MNGFSTAVSGVGSAIGRYFSVVSFIPSLFLTAFTFVLIECGAFRGSGELDWVKAGHAFANVGNLALLTLVSIALGIAVHPIQFALVQFFEGYWGTGPLAQRARVTRILHYRRKFRILRYGPGAEARLELREAEEKGEQLSPRDRVERISISEESRRLIRGYHAEDDIMPTRLGNVLRRYERLAGSQYGLDAVTVIRHIAFVAPPERLGYLNDQRQLLDLSVRMCATSIVATLIGLASLWRHGPWLLLALAPYAIAYLSYRGAVVVAHEYGAAFSAMIDLDRFAFYDYLRMPQPRTTSAERQMNTYLMRLLDHRTDVVLPYVHPQATDGADKDLRAT